MDNDKIKLKEENEMILHAIEIYESVRFIHYYNSHEEAACIFNREREKEIKKENCNIT